MYLLPIRLILQYLSTKSGSSHVDDETVRQLGLAEVALFANQAFQALDLVTQENAILSQANLAGPDPERSYADDRKQNGAGKIGYSDRLDGPISTAGRGGPLLSKSGKPLQPFTLTDKRSQLQKGVFRPSHNLPTMSIDEYLDEERRRGGILDNNESANARPEELDEDDMARADAETMKARAWDEFTEANPKGSGNTLNRG